MAKTKIEDITERALAYVKNGKDPGTAWVEVLKEKYSDPRQLENEVKHSCPKWAFCILCQLGYVKDVSAGCCPDSVGSRSANFALEAYTLLCADPSLASDKKKLKQQVFGTKDDEGYRTPREEVEVLLALWSAGALVKTKVAHVPVSERH